eukprot:comp21657_c0_seq1/m.30450 comp21657_c0_seq1/g.30450  ORF comp21657_c0_seq1/g.30450 comp21657_c0_seq1/m.30450 type:complete len:150 (-) comp21657_c0_seq1:192-641(-)
MCQFRRKKMESCAGNSAPDPLSLADVHTEDHLEFKVQNSLNEIVSAKQNERKLSADQPLDTLDRDALIGRVADLQHTVKDLTEKISDAQQDFEQLSSNNDVLATYLENLMASSSIFQKVDGPSDHQGGVPLARRTSLNALWASLTAPKK